MGIDEPRMLSASLFRAWWEKLYELFPQDPNVNKDLWQALEYIGKKSGAVRDLGDAPDLNPAFDWQHGAIDFGVEPPPFYGRRYNPEKLIADLGEATGIREGEW